MRNALPSLVLISRVLVIVATVKETTQTPNNQQIRRTILPGNDLGYISPNPTIVICCYTCCYDKNDFPAAVLKL